ncbi:YihY/virulence factor BrkB family protein [Candidatus Cyrtobacter comes]|uniref:YihY/virulence factor BrkB family protein n=2 Tax=Candidatus Cyrtobacter comes TaxID=675776 RepID=A0ABU5L8Z9_9RICK|nr:YihY/virulence factor BrkB family protein [Candidatus Cyrtobacter comes]
MLKIKKLVRAFYDAALDLNRHYGFEQAGYISFLVILTIFPFFAVLIIIVSHTAIKLDIHEVIISLIRGFLLEKDVHQFIDALMPAILEIISSPPSKFLTFALFSMVWTASSIFFAIRTVLNVAYRAQDKRHYLVVRLLSMLEFSVFTIMVAVILIAVTLFPYLLYLVKFYFTTQQGDGQQFASLSQYEYSLFGDNFALAKQFFYWFVICALTSSLFYWIPCRRQRFRDVIPGTIVVFIGWELFSYIFGYYIKYFPQINMVYGSIAGVVISLMYFYFCSIIFIYGAELNYRIEKIR